MSKHGNNQMAKSEIRESTLKRLFDRVDRGGYDKYLRKMNLHLVRGFRNQPITFDFPVTALVGPNGGGKTTLLGAAGCAYQRIQPRQFFAKSGKLDDSMQDWSIEHEAIDRSVNSRDTIKRTARFRQLRWVRDALDRSVVAFGVARTVPANERTELRRCASNQFSFAADKRQQLSATVARAVSRILGKDVSQYSHIQLDNRGRVSLLTGQGEDGTNYSEFHFGAGESSIIRMIMAIELLDDCSLVLIEEIENGLHPVATRRMVEYLIDVAVRKSIQSIFTTHSNDAIAPLPSKAIWASVNHKSFQGKLDIHSLRAIRGDIDSQLVIFVEDVFAASMVEQAVRSTNSDLLDLIEIHPMQGDGLASRMTRFHNENPAIAHPAICFLDGDSKQQEIEGSVYRLPGEMPERYIFDSVNDNIDVLCGVLTVRLLQPFERQASVKTTVREVSYTNHDPHLLFSQIGEKLGFLSEETVRGAFLSIWAEQHQADAIAILHTITEHLPQEVRGDGSPPRNHNDMGEPTT